MFVLANHSAATHHHCDSCPTGYYKKYAQIVDQYQKVRQHFTCEPCNCSPAGALNNGDCHYLTGKCSCKKNYDGFKCERCRIGYEKYGFDCIRCDVNQTNNCISALKSEIDQLADISRDYSFDTLKSLPVIKLNNFKEQISKQSESIDYWIVYEQSVNQVISNVSKLLPDLSGQFAMNADVVVSLCNRAENTIEKAIEAGNSSDRLFHQLRYHYLDLTHIITVVNATRKVNLNSTQCDLFLQQSHSMVSDIKVIGQELTEFHKSVEEHKIESDNLLQNVKNFLNESSIIPLDSELIDRMLRLTNISFDSFEIYEKQFSRPYLQTLDIISRSNQLYDQVQEIITNASVSIQETNSKLNESFSKLEMAKQNLSVISTLFEQFPSEFNNLKTNTIEKLKNTLIRLNPQNEEKYASICENHANELLNKAKQLKLRFNSTLSSASKYQNQTTENSYNQITDIIRSIQENVNEIEEKVQDLFREIYSEKETDEQAENRNKKSKQLLEKAENLNNLHLKDIQTRLDQSRQQIEMIQNKTFIIDEINGNIKSRNTILLDIESNLKELANKSQMFRGIDEMFPNTNSILNAYNDKINKFNNTIIQDYLPRINNLKSRKALLDGNFIGEIDKIKTNIENKSKYVKSFEIRNHKMENLHREMHRNLNEIITKIRLARQKASSIRISIRNKPIIETRNLTAGRTSLKLNGSNSSSIVQSPQQPPSTVATTLSSAQHQSSFISSLAGNSTSATVVVQPVISTTTPSTSSTPLQQQTNLNEHRITAQTTKINCKRTYESELEPSSVNTISLTFSINEQDQPDSLFLYVGAKYTAESDEKYNDFFVVEMVNRHIRFIWNSGAGVQVLEHPMRIKLNNLNLSDRAHWYRVQVLRLATTSHLQVQPLSNSNQAQELNRIFFKNESFDLFDGLDANETIYLNDNIIRTKSLSSSIRMDFDRHSELLVGTLPNNWIENDADNDLDYVHIPQQIKSRQMSGCLFELNLDGHNVNLWNFKTTTAACVGCREGVSEERPSNEFRFKGKFSYAMLPQINRYNSLKYLIQLNIRTFDENALLFFTCNPTTGDHIVLALVDGRIRFQIVSRNSVGQFIGLDLITKEKYNSGQWTNIAAERDNLEGLLRIDTKSEQLDDTIHLLAYPFASSYGANYNEKFNTNYNANLESTANSPVSSAAAAVNMFTNSRQLKLDLSDQYLFIGGIPLNYTSNQCSSKLPTFQSFQVCVCFLHLHSSVF